MKSALGNSKIKWNFKKKKMCRVKYCLPRFSSMFEVYITTSILQFAVKLLSQSHFKDGVPYALGLQMTDA